METKGLCRTCVQAKSCIFLKDPPVWQCEEFSADSSKQIAFKQAKTKPGKKQ